MNNKLIMALGAICGALVLLIAGEWFYAGFSRQRLLDTQLPKENTAPPETMPEINLTEKDEQSYAELVNRPLFIEGRKPVNEPPPESAVKATEVAINFDWVLNGIYTSANGTVSALLTKTATAKLPKGGHKRLVAGELLDGWKLAEIAGDHVLFTLDGAQKNLPLHKSKPKAPIKPNNGQPPPEGAPVPEGTPPPEGAQPPEGTPPPEGVPPPAPEIPEEMTPEPELPEDTIENSENE